MVSRFARLAYVLISTLNLDKVFIGYSRLSLHLFYVINSFRIFYFRYTLIILEMIYSRFLWSIFTRSIIVPCKNYDFITPNRKPFNQMWEVYSDVVIVCSYSKSDLRPALRCHLLCQLSSPQEDSVLLVMANLYLTWIGVRKIELT